MKRKRFERGDLNGEEVRSVSGNPNRDERKQSSNNGKRGRKLGGGRGGGLSLEAFAAAKSKQQTKFPSQTRERREFYSNAKKVQKYKKLRKQFGLHDQAVSQDGDEPTAGRHVTAQDKIVSLDDRPSRKGKGVNFGEKKLLVKREGKQQFKNYQRKQQDKGLSQIERIRQKVEEENLERERQRREKEQELAEQQEAREKLRRERKEVQAKLRKKTSRGQPVMKHQMERLLEAIQRRS